MYRLDGAERIEATDRLIEAHGRHADLERGFAHTLAPRLDRAARDVPAQPRGEAANLRDRGVERIDLEARGPRPDQHRVRRVQQLRRRGLLAGGESVRWRGRGRWRGATVGQTDGLRFVHDGGRRDGIERGCVRVARDRERTDQQYQSERAVHVHGVFIPVDRRRVCQHP